MAVTPVMAPRQKGHCGALPSKQQMALAHSQQSLWLQLLILTSTGASRHTPHSSGASTSSHCLLGPAQYESAPHKAAQLHRSLLVLPMRRAVSTNLASNPSNDARCAFSFSDKVPITDII